LLLTISVFCIPVLAEMTPDGVENHPALSY